MNKGEGGHFGSVSILHAVFEVLPGVYPIFKSLNFTFPIFGFLCE